MRQIIILFLLVTILGSGAYATAQYPDKIIYKGKEYALYSNPMEDFFKKHPEKKPTGGVVSTALWRGYVATFEVKDSLLYVKDIEIEIWDKTNNDYDTKWISVMDSVFPNESMVKVDWLTGLLVIPHGDLVNYVHMGYGSTYEKYILLEIDAGVLKDLKQYGFKEYEEFKEKQFQAFRKTEEYERIKAELLKDGDSEEFIDSFLKNFITSYTSRILIE